MLSKGELVRIRLYTGEQRLAIVDEVFKTTNGVKVRVHHGSWCGTYDMKDVCATYEQVNTHPISAPDVLEALVELLDACPTSCEDKRLIEAQRKAEAAIAKAREKPVIGLRRPTE